MRWFHHGSKQVSRYAPINPFSTASLLQRKVTDLVQARSYTPEMTFVLDIDQTLATVPEGLTGATAYVRDSPDKKHLITAIKSHFVSHEVFEFTHTLADIQGETDFFSRAVKERKE